MRARHYRPRERGRGTDCRFDDYLCPSRVALDYVTPAAILFEIRVPYIAPAAVTVLYYCICEPSDQSERREHAILSVGTYL